MKNVNLTINDKKISVPERYTIIKAAKENNIHIPHLCYLENIHSIGSCRICLVHVEGQRNLMASCVTEVTEGMVVNTNTERVRQARKIVYELMLSDHNQECLSCDRNQACEFQKVGEMLQIKENRMNDGAKSKVVIDNSSASITRDASKCILCRRCVTICNEVQGVGILNAQHRGFDTFIGPSDGINIGSTSCINCGQCVVVCPVGALKEHDSTDKVWDALHDPKKVTIIQSAPAIRAALGEEFGYEVGTSVTGKMAAAFRTFGFDYIFDTNFAADLTIIEEGSEFLQRVRKVLNKEEVSFPMITSCSPGWIKFIEHNYPKQLDHLSSCKSPQMMLGALTKSYFAEKIGVDPKDIFMVSMMPCTAKKFEITRPEMVNNGVPNIDAVLTTRELAKMIKNAGIDFRSLPDEKFDSPLGFSSGAADIFANSGGVMEAAIRTVYELVTGRELPTKSLHVKPLMGLERIKTAELKIENPLPEWKGLEGFVLKVAVTSGTKGAAILLDEIKSGKSEYHFIEVMGCPGGCICGGGQPRPLNGDVREKRLNAIIKEDEGKTIRKSHMNPDITKIYEEFLGKPLGHKSHELLHTYYLDRSEI